MPRSAAALGDLGTSFGWPIFLGLIVVTSNVWGVLLGEWRDRPLGPLPHGDWQRHLSGRRLSHRPNSPHVMDRSYMKMARYGPSLGIRGTQYRIYRLIITCALKCRWTSSNLSELVFWPWNLLL